MATKTPASRNILTATGTYLPTSWFRNRLTIGADLLGDEQTRYFPKNAAGQYAGLAGLALGPVLEITETPPPPPDARPMRLLAAEAPGGGPATEPGETTVRAAVSVTWALDRRPPPG